VVVRVFLPNALHHPWSRQIRQAVRSTNWFTSHAGFVRQKPVPELRIPVVRVEQGIGPIRRGELGGGDRLTPPPVVRLTRELKRPFRFKWGFGFGCAVGTVWLRASRRRRREAAFEASQIICHPSMHQTLFTRCTRETQIGVAWPTADVSRSRGDAARLRPWT